MRILMKLKHGQPTSGNILKPSEKPYKIYGETSVPVPSGKTKVVLGLSLLAVIGVLLSTRRH